MEIFTRKEIKRVFIIHTRSYTIHCNAVPKIDILHAYIYERDIRRIL